ncbi:MAG: hypothetical protein JWN56_896 [Sphingobacteriales bacterium]|nr:hypothetical protein [Sphingobacteriales bacterium]
MSFIFPGFLFALFAVAIPVIIHLFNFRRFKKVYFSNVRFLKSVAQETSSYQHLKNRLILFSRILAIVFLVLAFAKPYIPSMAESNTSGQKVVSVFIDNSYSMETVNKQGTLLDEAKRRGKEIASAYSLNDKFQLLTNDFQGQHQRLLSYEDFLNAIDEVKISSSNRDLNQIINKQQDVFASEPNASKSIFVISDFQRNLNSSEKLKVDSSISLNMVMLQANTQPNISIDSVWFTSPVHRPGENEKLVVRLRNNSDEKSENVPIKLTVNKQQKAVGNASILPRATAFDTLSFNGLSAGWQEGELEITDYPIVFDDRFFFSFKVYDALPLLIINGSVENDYLNALYKADPFFKASNVSAGNINYSELGNYPLIILNEIKDYSSGLVQQLKLYVQQGGSLMIFPSLETDLSTYRNFLQVLGTDLPNQVVTEKTKVVSINLQHLVFKGVFERSPQKLDLPIVDKYVSYTTGSRTSRQSLLELPGRKVFFNQYAFGKGKVYLSAVPLNAEASNFARHSLFVPILFQASLLSFQTQKIFYTLGDNQTVELPRINLNANQSLRVVKKNFEVIPDARQTSNSTRLYLADQVKETGNYNLLKGDSLLAKLAFNDNRKESDLSYMDEKELKSIFPDNKIETLKTGSAPITSHIKTSNQGIQLWKLCIILALLSLAAEVLLIRFYMKTKRAAHDL